MAKLFDQTSMGGEGEDFQTTHWSGTGQNHRLQGIYLLIIKST